MLYRRPNSSKWWCRFTAPDGKEVRRTTKTSNKEEALEFEALLRASLWRTQHLGDKPRMTWKQAVVKWLDETKDKASHKNDISALNYADPFLGHRFLDEIDIAVLEDIIQAKLKTGVANATVNRIMEVIRTVLNKAAKQWEWTDRATYVRMLPEPKQRIRWLTQVEARNLLSTLSPSLKAMTQFSLATGLRESNVTGLEWSQIDMLRKVAWIHADQAKARKAIGVPLNDDAITVLRSQIGKHTSRVFTYKGNPIKKANTKAWRKGLVRAGIQDFRWHDLRHTWASWHVQAGTSLHVLQELGGWSDIRMVQKYAHLNPSHLAGFANNISLLKEENIPIHTLSGTLDHGQKKTAR